MSVDRSPPRGAVFLSYASQDAEAVKRIAEALRAAGVEVWFDADGGLEHGDEWDAKIRKQIKECVLFIPVISANTQARHEGYFRIEWDLAAERARGIASGVPFILPVVIDETREPEALVPDRFRMVQWTKLPGGVVTAEVKARYLKLWSHRTGLLKHRPMTPGSSLPLEPGDGAALPSDRPTRRRVPAAAWISVAAVVGALGTFVALRPPPQAEAGMRAPVSAAAATGTNEADALITQARDLVCDPESARADFALAENLLKRATELAPASGPGWGVSALLNHYAFARAYDADRQRLVRSQAEADKALRLAPGNVDALLALGMHRRIMGETDRAREYLERARAADPTNVKVILEQRYLFADHVARANFLIEAAAKVAQPAELLYYAANSLRFARQYEAASAVLDRAMAKQPFWRMFVSRADFEHMSSADAAKVDAWLDRVPELKRDEPRVAFMRYLAARLRRDGAAAVRALTTIAADYFEDNFFTGPKAYLLAQAYELAGQRTPALEQWQLAERAVREKLAQEPAALHWRAMLAVILVGQGRAVEAKAQADACAADERLGRGFGNFDAVAVETTAQAFMVLGEPARALALLRQVRPRVFTGSLSSATIGVDPMWGPLRALPDYSRFVEELRESEHPVAATATGGAAAPEKSVAVLAFRNVGGDPANEAIVEGIGLDLIAVLGRVPGLTVRGNSSLGYFKDSVAPAEEKGRKLSVAYLVDGSVQRAGSTLRLVANLTRAATNEVVWTSPPLMRDVQDIFAVQEEIAGLIAQQLSLKLGVSSAAATTMIAAEAFELYVQARQAWNERTPAGFDRAEQLLNLALAREPRFARAHAALADVWQQRAQETLEVGRFGTRESAVQRRILTKIQQALDMDPLSAEAHASLGGARWIGWNLVEAERALRRATELNANYATAHQWLGRVLLNQGRVDEAIASLQRAVELDPLSSRIADNRALPALLLGRLGEALAFYERALALRPDNEQALKQNAIALAALGRREQAREIVRGIPEAQWPSWENRVEVLARAGLNDEAQARFAAAVTPSMDRARLLLLLGRIPEAVEVLEANTVVAMTIDQWLYLPAIDPIRADPRFAQFLATLGLTEAHARAQAWRAANPPEKAAR